MTEENIQTRRVSKVAIDLNIGWQTIVEFLSKKGQKVDNNPNAKISNDQYNLLLSEFQSEKTVKEKSKLVSINSEKKESVTISESEVVSKEQNEKESEELIIKTTQPLFTIESKEEVIKAEPNIKIVGKINLEKEKKNKEKEEVKKAPIAKKEVVKEIKEIVEEVKKVEVKETPEHIETEYEEINLKFVGKIDIKETDKSKKGKKKEQTEKEKKSKKGKKEKIEIEEKVVDIVEVVNVTEVEKEVPQIENVTENVIEPENIDIIEIIESETEKEDLIYKTEVKKLEGPTILGRMELPVEKKEEPKKPIASSSNAFDVKKKKRKRIRKEWEKEKPTDGTTTPHETLTVIKVSDRPQSQQGRPQHGGSNFKDKNKKKNVVRVEPTEEEIQKQIKETLARLSGSGKSKASKYRRLKRDEVNLKQQEQNEQNELDKKVIKVTEFVTANELATMISVPVTQIISTCMHLGMFVSINQRLDAETLTIVAEEFGYKVEFVSVEVQEAIKVDEDKVEDLLPRPPIVTVMGHVDHGKTSLLDYIRKTNVIAGEAGGITQHIGAYEVSLENGKKITFLDTPGHEAFTAMRARGAKVTDIVIIVVAADDSVMPQTIEAINHAQAAGVPIVIAINKIDKPGANIEKIKQELSSINILVEDWGGKYQFQEISAKKGINIEPLLDKVLLEAEMLDLKANPNKMAVGAVIESTLDKGRGYVATILVDSGTLKVGDIILAGCQTGRVKAMFNERNQRVDIAGPSTPVLILGLDGAPQAGDKFNVMEDEKEAKSIAFKRQQLQREQGIRTQKHITLDEIGRRIAIGDFKELNIIVKGDFDGSVEAISDALLKLSTPKVQVNVIHKSVGQVTESDVLLASASNAIIIAFQVRPSLSTRKLAEQEQIDIRLYSIIYDAIEEVKAAMEGMLSPEIQEKIVCNIEIRDVFKITKVGTVAGCFVLDGRITRNTKVRLIRDGIVVYTGQLASLKRFKDDVKEVSAGYECGLNVYNFNDIKVGDIVEGYDEIEVKAKL